ncbi:hypothetical protein KW805_02475 [Candidatus Pacearchaeota archaeon]|nr:hypothetical protein [Candidatus Pacearchaeota archaeon]
MTETSNSISRLEKAAETISYHIPTFFHAVNVPEDDEGKRKMIHARSNETVLVRDGHSHSLLQMGRIRVDNEDKECYYFQLPTEFNQEYTEERLWYNDVAELQRSGIGGTRISLKKRE